MTNEQMQKKIEELEQKLKEAENNNGIQLESGDIVMIVSIIAMALIFIFA